MSIARLSSIPSCWIVAGALLLSSARAAPSQSVQDLVRTLKISFPGDSSSVLFLEQGGRRFRIDTASHAITEVSAIQSNPPQPSSPASAYANTSGQTLFRANCARCHGPDGKGIPSLGTPDFTQTSVDEAHVADVIRQGKEGKMPSFAGRLPDAQITEIAQWVNSLSASAAQSPGPHPEVYRPGDDVLFTLPTGRSLERGGLYVNFTHRFPYDPVFVGQGRAGILFGLDDFALASFGLRYGVTSRFSVSAFRSPSFIGRPIQLMAGYDLLREQDSGPFNLTARASIEGQNNFRKNFTESLEAIFSRSMTHRAQIYAVPTISFNDHRVVQGSLNSSGIADHPGVNAFSIGFGAAVDVRPTVALVGEVIPTLIGGDQLGIHRPAFSFGIQKKIYRHAFTFGFSNSPGVTVSQRAGTDATYLRDPSADKFSRIFVGFDLTRQLH